MTSRFPILQAKQEVTRLLSMVVPPFETGMMWSICNFAPSWGVAPQYWQVKLSLSKTIKRFFRGTSLLVFKDTSGSLPNKRSALATPPNLLYVDSLGNPGSLLISCPPTLRPFRTQASSSIVSRYSSVIKSLRFFRDFMGRIVARVFIIVNSKSQ